MSYTSSETRANRNAAVDRATEIQTRAALIGGATFGALGVAAATLAHYTWPRFRRQTLAGKAFLISIFSIYGFVFHAEDALMAHEREERHRDGELRRAARLDLAHRGVFATETEILRWVREREAAETERSQYSNGAGTQGPG